MANILSEGLSHAVAEKRLSVRNTRDAIFLITLADLTVILPSFLIMLVMNIRTLMNHGPLFVIIVPSFLLFLPVSIIISGSFLGRGTVSQKANGQMDDVAPALLFLLLIFSIFSIYIPVVQKLASIIPSFTALNVVESVVVLVFLVFVIKNITTVLKER